MWQLRSPVAGGGTCLRLKAHPVSGQRRHGSRTPVRRRPRPRGESTVSSWNAMSYEAKDTILRVVRQEATQFFEMVDSDEVWERPTGAGHWQVRDIVGHIV